MTLTKGTGQPGTDLLLKHFGALLSERELEVGRLAIRGASRAEMASLLFLSENTIKTHIRNILKKTRAVSLHDLYRRLADAAMGGQAKGRSTPLGELMYTLRQGAEAGRGTTPMAVILLDLDEASGCFPLWLPRDRAMLMAGEQLTQAVRPGDMVTQWQESWLLVMLAGATLATAEEVGRRLSQKLQRWGEEQGLRLSIVTVACCTEEGISPSALLDSAKSRIQLATKPAHLLP